MIQSILTAINSTGGSLKFTDDIFIIDTPLDIATSITANRRPIHLLGVPSSYRIGGTQFEVSASFPTGRYVIETSGATDGSNKCANLFLSGLSFYNLNFATTNAGIIKFESDDVIFRSLYIDNIFSQYMWRSFHLIGSVWGGYINNITFSGFNAGFSGDCDIKLEVGTHTHIDHFRPKICVFNNMTLLRNPGQMANFVNCQDGGYNTFDKIFIDGYKYTDSVFLFTGQSHDNTIDHLSIIDTVAPTSDTRRGTIVLDGSGVYDNKFINCRIPRGGPGATDISVAIIGGAFRNHLELAGYWGLPLKIDNIACGDYNTIEITIGSWDGTTTPYGNVPVKPTFTGNATENGRIRIIDKRLGAKTTGTSTQSGDASTLAFNIAHGCFTTPATWWATPTSTDAKGTPIVTATSTNLVITYAIAPPTGTSNLTWVWGSEVY